MVFADEPYFSNSLQVFSQKFWHNPIWVLYRRETKAERSLADILSPHFFLCAIWLLGLSSVPHIISAVPQSTVVLCLVTIRVSLFLKACLCPSDTTDLQIWSWEWPDGEVWTCQLRIQSHKLSCKSFKSRKKSFQIVSGNHTWINVRFMFQIWALSRFSVLLTKA